MAFYWAVKLTLSFLVLTSMQGSSGELENTDVETLIAAFKRVTQAVDLYGGVLKETLHTRKQNNDTITSSEKPSIVVVRVINLLKADLKESERKVELLKKEKKDLEAELETCNTKVEQLQKENKDLEAEKEMCNTKVETMNKELEESTCRHPEKKKIRELVQETRRSQNWTILRAGLENVLDKDSYAYYELKSLADFSDEDTLYWSGLNILKDLIKLLVLCGGAINVRDGGNNTFLHGAMRGGNAEMIQWLLDHGADINVRDDDGYTPLMNGVGGNDLNIVKLLVENGADTTVKTNYGDTALDIAGRYDAFVVEDYLSKLPH